jgi:hypothetical protein
VKKGFKKIFLGKNIDRTKKEVLVMQNTQMQFAGLKEQELKEIKQLEQKMNTVLIAYSKDVLEK